MSEPTSTELVHVVDRREIEQAKRQRAPLKFTEEQYAMIRDTFAGGASEKEFEVLMEIARMKRLNPLLGQIHFVKRWTQDRGDVWATQTGIDGFRSIAEDTGVYDGQDEPEFQYVDTAEGRVIGSAKVKVYRKDISRPFVGIAHFAEYVQRKKDGSPTKMWNEKPHIMLGKCAEALALRKAFPQDLGDLYTSDELGRDYYEPTKEERALKQAQGVTQMAIEQGKPTTSPERPDFAKLLEECPRNTKALAEIGGRLDRELPKGDYRTAMSKLYTKIRDEVVAEEKKARAADAAAKSAPPVDRVVCTECSGINGRHAPTCPEGDGAEPQTEAGGAT